MPAISTTDVTPFSIFTGGVGHGTDLEAITVSAFADDWDWSGIGWLWNDVGTGVFNSCQAHCVLISDKWALGGHCASAMAAGDGVYFRDTNGDAVLAEIASVDVTLTPGIELIRFTTAVAATVTRYPLCISISELIGEKIWCLETPGDVKIVEVEYISSGSVNHDGNILSGSSGFPGFVPLTDGNLAILFAHLGADNGYSVESNLSSINTVISADGTTAQTYDAATGNYSGLSDTFVYLSSVIKAGTANGGTSAAIDTTGATVLFVGVASFGANAAPTLSDSPGNTANFTGFTTYASTYRVRWYYCNNPITSATHTFTLSGTNSFPVLTAWAFSGSHATPFDQQTGSALATNSTSHQGGSLTPTHNNSLVLTAFGGGGSTLLVSGGFEATKLAANNSGGSNIAGGGAYLIQTTKVAANPSWSWTTTGHRTVANIVFRPAPISPVNWYVDTGAAGDNDGTSPENAFTTATSAEVQVHHGDYLHLNAASDAPIVGELTFDHIDDLTVVCDDGPDGETHSYGARTAVFTGPTAGVFQSASAATQPSHVLYDYKRDDVSGTVTGWAYDARDLALLNQWGIATADVLAPYGFLKLTTGSQTAPGDGEYGYSGATLYINPTGAPDLATVNLLNRYVPAGEQGIYLSTCDGTRGSGRNVQTLFPGIAGGVGNQGYGVKIEGGGDNVWNDSLAISAGYHASGAGATCDGYNRINNCTSVGMSGDSGGFQNPFVLAQKDASVVFDSEGSDLVAIGCPHFLTTGVPINLTWTVNPCLSHADATTDYNHVRWTRVLGIDKTTAIEAKHTITNTQTTASPAVSHQDGTLVDGFDADDYPCQCSDSAFRGNIACQNGIFYDNCLFDRTSATKNALRHYDGTGGASHIYARDCTFISGNYGTVAGAIANFFDNLEADSTVTFENCKILIQGRALTAGFGITSDVADSVVLKLIGCQIDSDGVAANAILKGTAAGVSNNGFRNVLSDGTNVFGTNLTAMAYTSAGAVSIADIAAWRSTIVGGSTDTQADLGWGLDPDEYLFQGWLDSVESSGSSSSTLFGTVSLTCRSPIES